MLCDVFTLGLKRLITVMSSIVGCREGDVVALYDGRPTGDIFLATGQIEDQNPSDNLFMNAELVKADRLYTAKKQIVESLGYTQLEVGQPLVLSTVYCSSCQKDFLVCRSRRLLLPSYPSCNG